MNYRSTHARAQQKVIGLLIRIIKTGFNIAAFFYSFYFSIYIHLFSLVDASQI